MISTTLLEPAILPPSDLALVVLEPNVTVLEFAHPVLAKLIAGLCAFEVVISDNAVQNGVAAVLGQLLVHAVAVSFEVVLQ